MKYRWGRTKLLSTQQDIHHLENLLKEQNIKSFISLLKIKSPITSNSLIKYVYNTSVLYSIFPSYILVMAYPERGAVQNSHGQQLVNTVVYQNNTTGTSNLLCCEDSCLTDYIYSSNANLVFYVLVKANQIYWQTQILIVFHYQF